MPEKDTQAQIVEVISKTEADSGAQLPEHAILRFARVPASQNTGGF